MVNVQLPRLVPRVVLAVSTDASGGGSQRRLGFAGGAVPVSPPALSPGLSPQQHTHSLFGALHRSTAGRWTRAGCRTMPSLADRSRQDFKENAPWSHQRHRAAGRVSWALIALVAKCCPGLALCLNPREGVGRRGMARTVRHALVGGLNFKPHKQEADYIIFQEARMSKARRTKHMSPAPQPPSALKAAWKTRTSLHHKQPRTPSLQFAFAQTTDGAAGRSLFVGRWQPPRSLSPPARGPRTAHCCCE